MLTPDSQKPDREDLYKIRRLEELEQLFSAIQNGEVDAFLISGESGDQVYTLKNAERPYRVMIEQMSEGALTLSDQGLILYTNESFACMVKFTSDALINTPISRYIDLSSQKKLQRLLKHGGREEVSLLAKDNTLVPVYFSVSMTVEDQVTRYWLLVTDLTQHIRSEKILASERFSRTLLEQSANAILICDNNGVVIRASEQAFDLFGNKLVGQLLDTVFQSFNFMSTFEKVTQEARETVKFSLIRDARVPSGCEVTAIIQDQLSWNFLLNYSRITAGESVLGFSISLTDVTEHKEAEKEKTRLLEELKIHELELESQTRELRQAQVEAKESRDKYLDLYDNAPVAYLTLKDGLIQEANQTAAQLLGLEVSSLVKTRFSEYIMKDSLAQFYIHVMRAIDTGTNQACEIELKGKNKSNIYARLNSMAIKSSRGGHYRLRTTISDITERQKAEEALKESEEKYRSLFENLNSAAMLAEPILDQDGRLVDLLFLMANPATEKHLGKSPEELIGKHYSEVFAYTGRNPVFDIYNQVLSSGEPFKGEIAPSDTNRYFDIAVYRLLPKRLAFTFTDITERKKTEAALDKAKNELEIKVKKRTAELARANEQLRAYSLRITQVQEEERKRIAYELHDDTAQYLAILKMQLDSIIHSGEIQSPKLLEKLGYLEKDAGRAVDDLRRYSHELRPGVLEHAGLIPALEQIAEDQNNMGRIHVEVNIEGTEVEIPENIKLGFFRIAQEAISNTLKHAKTDSTKINLQFKKSHVTMTISDNGLGFSVKQALARIGEKGNLGLMSMQERAKLINANLQIESKPGKGTVITVAAKLG